MGMRNAILQFHRQFAYTPEVANEEKLGRQEKFVITGMGGSNLVGELVKIREPSLPVVSHRNYGLPCLSSSELQESLVIASSYSGNTEETIDALQEALKKGIPAAAVARVHDPALKKIFEKKQEQGKPSGIALTAVVHKLLHITYAVLKQQKPFEIHLQN